MKKILILSYHFEPMNVIGSKRTIGYANHFKKFDFEPTIITHQWDKTIEEQTCLVNQINSNLIFETHEKYSVYKLPIASFKRGKVLKMIEQSAFNKIGIFFSWMLGHLDTKSELLNCHLTQKEFLKNHLKDHAYDLVIGIYAPHFHLRTCSWIKNEFEIPYVLDYRDFWDNRILNPNHKPSLTEKIKSFFALRYWKKWSKKALFQTIVSEDWAEKIETLTNKKSLPILNGYENDIQANIENIYTPTFNIVSTGTVYADQDLTILLDGILMFLENINSSTVRIFFIGIENNNVSPKKTIEKIKDKLKGFDLTITKRLPQKEAMQFQKEASVLIFPTIKNQSGFYSGKIFEYISSYKPIIAAPKDIRAVSDLIELTETGICTESATEVKSYLQNLYNQWSTQGYISFKGNVTRIAFFSRENQTKILSTKIKEFLK